jgi:hypothetical protein
MLPRLKVYAVVGLRSSLDHPLGGAIGTFIRREDAERVIEEVRGDESEPPRTCGSKSGSSRRAG